MIVATLSSCYSEGVKQEEERRWPTPIIRDGSGWYNH